MLLASVHHRFVNALKVTKTQNPSFLGGNGNVNISVVDGLADSISPCPKNILQESNIGIKGRLRRAWGK